MEEEPLIHNSSLFPPAGGALNPHGARSLQLGSGTRAWVPVQGFQQTDGPQTRARPPLTLKTPKTPFLTGSDGHVAPSGGRM
ncbi:hypothetical protein EYF80_022747 [Liparis tanakae]|uniref:Uncharacterized protein n=1 Tax=Liparis tanakae TaxID=230148 RepID=A0A4Z2HPU0_9TELE|nr:hypothetical protein EYF80_022747 [Liparis tanakae]